jgi:glycosyltransferase involved in cell wall biosynthesis
LDSILAQSWADWEVWIVDDGSTDHTEQVAKLYQIKDKRIKYHYQENHGLSNARNTGLSLSTGEYLQFLDADDLISKHKLELQVRHLEENPEISISYCQTWYFDTKFPEKTWEDLALKNQTRHPILDDQGFGLLQTLIRGNYTTVSSPLVRRAIIEDGIVFPESVTNSEDWYFWLQCALRGHHFQYLPNTSAFTKIRVHADSMSQQKLQMYYGELQLRQWLSEQITGTSLHPKEKEQLLILNQVQEERLFKHTMLTGPLWNVPHLKQMFRLSDFSKLIKYHNLARKHQRVLSHANF